MPANPFGILLRNRRAGHDALAWARPELHVVTEFTLSSPAFEHGATIPARYRGRVLGPNISPELIWAAPPAGTAELLLVAQDADSPRRSAAIHLLMAGIDPASTGLPENSLGKPGAIAGIRHGKGALGHRGWIGPMPIRSHGPHSYVFQLFALDGPSDLSDGFTFRDAACAMRGHIIGRARLDGVYENH